MRLTPVRAARRSAPSRQRGLAPRVLTGLTTGLTTAGLVLVLAPLGLTGTPSASAPATPPATTGSTIGAAGDVTLVASRSAGKDRRLMRYRVRRGDTASSLAVRYHAWTAELVARNGSRLRVGEIIAIPVVVSARRACTVHKHHRATKVHHKHHKKTHKKTHKKPTSKVTRKRARAERAHRARRLASHSVRHRTGWHHADASRTRVRRTIAAKARRHHVNVDLALAIAWQESGWQQRRTSSAGAIGAMQIMPATGRWVSQIVGRRLNRRDLYHNAAAGVVLIRILRSEARPRVAVAGYYQGLAGVRRDGMYPSTRLYVANVMALKRRIARGERLT